MLMLKAVRSLGTGAGGHPVASCGCPEEEGQGVAAPGCQNVRCAGHPPRLGFRSLSARKW